MARRIQSSSSINSYKKCPRKYYYSYIRQLESLPNIHQVRGNVAHSVLEKFFDTDVSDFTMENFEGKFSVVIQELMIKEWQDAEDKLSTLNLSDSQRQFYFEETVMMLLNWLSQFADTVQLQTGSFPEIFKQLTPIREKLYISEVHQVRGFIDAIENINNELRIMDYKTSSRFGTRDHRLQLAIYSLLYHEKHGKMPDKVGIYFLRDRAKFIDVDQELLEFAKKEVALIHEKTESDDITDYPKKKSGLCKYSTGQCEYYDVCQKED